jgi:hypothetical protein
MMANESKSSKKLRKELLSLNKKVKPYVPKGKDAKRVKVPEERLTIDSFKVRSYIQIRDEFEQDLGGLAHVEGDDGDWFVWVGDHGYGPFDTEYEAECFLKYATQRLFYAELERPVDVPIDFHPDSLAELIEYLDLDEVPEKAEDSE